MSMRALHQTVYRRLANLLPQLVDTKTGIIASLSETPMGSGAPRFFQFEATAASTRAFSDQDNFSYGGGCSMDRGVALAKAIGEAVERYCSAIYDRETMPLYASKDAPFPCSPPDSYAMFHRTQIARPHFPFDAFDDSTPLRWAPALNLVTKETVYVPACRVYVPYHVPTDSPEVSITQPISTGLALHCSFEEAAVAGLCEVIERDVFTLAWLAKMAPPQIEPETLPSDLYAVYREFTRTGADVTLFDASLDHAVTSVLSVYKHPRAGNPAFCIANSTAPTAHAAVLKSLEELDHTRRYAANLLATRPLVDLDSHDGLGPMTQGEHVRYWCDHSKVADTDFLFGSDERTHFSALRNLHADSAEDLLTALIETIASNGGTPYAKDVTSPDIASLGLFSVRAIIPEYQPMYSGHQIRSMGGERLWTVPQKLGYEALEGVEDINSHPHPFP